MDQSWMIIQSWCYALSCWVSSCSTSGLEVAFLFVGYGGVADGWGRGRGLLVNCNDTFYIHIMVVIFCIVLSSVFVTYLCLVLVWRPYNDSSGIFAMQCPRTGDTEKSKPRNCPSATDWSAATDDSLFSFRRKRFRLQKWSPLLAFEIHYLAWPTSFLES